MDPLTKKIILVSIAAVIIPLIRYYQKSKTSSYNLRNVPNSLPNSENNNKNTNSNNEFDYSIITTIKSIINDKKYILLNESINDEQFEIEFKNYDWALHDFKRKSTYIKIIGNLNNDTLNFTTWSDEYEFGQNAHNESILNAFKRELALTDQNEGVNPIKSLKDELGVGAFQRWDQLTKKMLFESKKTRDQVLAELVSYGLKKEMAEKMIDLHKEKIE